MAECSPTAGIHLIVAQRFVTKNNDSPFCVPMHSLGLCDRATDPANPATSSHGMAAAIARPVAIASPAISSPADGSETCPSSSSALVATKSLAHSESRTRRILGSLRLSTRRLIVLAAIVLGMRIFVG